MSDYETVLRTPELGPGTIAEVHAHGRAIAVTNVGQTYYAFDAACPIDGTNLAREGRIDGDLITCPGDDARFDVRSGRQVEGDAALRTHSVRIEGNEIRVGPAEHAGNVR